MGEKDSLEAMLQDEKVIAELKAFGREMEKYAENQESSEGQDAQKIEEIKHGSLNHSVILSSN